MVLDKSVIGQKLKTLRGDRTQAEIAAAIGVTVAAISQYERGERLPDDRSKVALAELFETDVSSLFFAGK